MTRALIFEKEMARFNLYIKYNIIKLRNYYITC